MDNIKEKLLLDIATYMLIDGARNPGSYVRAYWRLKKIEKIILLFEKSIESKKGLIKVIDVGCGLGQKMYFLNQLFGGKNELEFIGVDMDPAAIYFCNLKKERYEEKNVNFDISDVNDLKFPDESFDIIINSEVLEHLESPEEALEEFYRILKPGGSVIITTPNKDNLIVRCKNVIFKILGRKIRYPEDPDEFEYERVGHGHISVKGLSEWIKIFKKYFIVEEIERGSILSGTPKQDKNRVVFAVILLLESVLDKLPIFKNLTEDVIVRIRKPAR